MTRPAAPPAPPPFRNERLLPAKPAPTSIEDAFLRLGEIAGADRASLRALLPTAEKSEHDAFFSILHVLAPHLQPLRPRLGGSLLGWLLSDAPIDDGEEPRARYYPKEARKALKTGEIVAQADADVWLFVEQPGGTAHVCHAHPESFSVLGESVVEWLALEIEKLTHASASRGKPGQARQLLDEALARLAALSGEVNTREKLARLPAAKEGTPWNHLQRALATLDVRWSPEILERLEGRLLGRLLRGALHDTDDEICEVEEDDDELDGINPVYVKRYPTAARRLLQQVRPTDFVASSGPELWFVLRENTEGSPSSWTLSLHHAACNGYEQLAPSLQEWLTAEVIRLEERLP